MTTSSQPIRSIFIDRGLNFHGGVTTALLNLARSVDPDQICIEIGSLETPSPEMLGQFTDAHVPVHHLSDQGYIRPAAALRRVLRQSRTQLVVCNSLKAYVVAKIACVGLPVRLMFWIHGISEIVSNPLKAGVYRRLVRRDTLIFITQAARLANLPARHQGRHHLVYYGIENPAEYQQWQPYERSVRAQYGLAQRDLVLMYVGSFVPYKDQKTLMLAFDRLWARHPQLQLLLIGQGERLPAMREVAASLASASRIHFMGPRADARQLFGLADIYVHPAHPEGFGLAVAEAMLAGLPVVGAADGGIPENVHDGVNGLLFEPGNVAHLEQQLERLILDPSLAHRLAVAGNDHAVRRYSPRRFAVQMTNLLVAEAQSARIQLSLIPG
jgi:glycosyltransferase involved in cell wall biosynthesis